ncbi:hypothetical protein BLA29_014422 [Euroglyphus maynei]|uniref:Uncharacterized protein n=1 Tax=Euroglyphus maynei TaxID=6958 RepID=A0A1Y3AMT0_EURMA|nr:hypothetical protein BLA29_014422 [Euroglyphus maynei]
MPENMDDFSGYKSLFHIHSNSFDSNNVNPSSARNGSLCDADRKYIRPSVIKDIHNFILFSTNTGRNLYKCRSKL